MGNSSFFLQSSPAESLILDALIFLPTLHVHASYEDLNAGSYLPGRLNTIVNAIGTTTLVTSPSAGLVRNIKTIVIRNVGASSSIFELFHNNGTSNFILLEVTLQPNWTLMYTDGSGWQLVNANGVPQEVTS